MDDNGQLNAKTIFTPNYKKRTKMCELKEDKVCWKSSKSEEK